MNTALTVLAWLAVIWLTAGLLGGIYALYRARKDWR